jgi:hypothetical protein
MGFFRMPWRVGTLASAGRSRRMAGAMVDGQASCGHDAAHVDGRHRTVKQDCVSTCAQSIGGHDDPGPACTISRLS